MTTRQKGGQDVNWEPRYVFKDKIYSHDSLVVKALFRRQDDDISLCFLKSSEYQRWA